MRPLLLIAAAVGVLFATIDVASASTPAPACPMTVGGATYVKQQIYLPSGTTADIRVLCYYQRPGQSPDFDPAMWVDFVPKGGTATLFYGCGQNQKSLSAREYGDATYNVSGQFDGVLANASGAGGDAVWKAATLAFMKDAEAFAKPCTAVGATKHTWTLASTTTTTPEHTPTGDVGYFTVEAAHGSGTFSLSPNGEIASATGTLTFTTFLSDFKARAVGVVHIALKVERGASFRRRSGQIDDLVLTVRVTNLRTSHVNCIADPEGTLSLTDGYGVVPDTFALNGVCELKGKKARGSVTIR